MESNLTLTQTMLNKVNENMHHISLMLACQQEHLQIQLHVQRQGALLTSTTPVKQPHLQSLSVFQSHSGAAVTSDPYLSVTPTSLPAKSSDRTSSQTFRKHALMGTMHNRSSSSTLLAKNERPHLHFFNQATSHETFIDYRDHVLSLAQAHALSEVLLSKSLKIMAQDCELFQNNGYTGERVFTDSYRFLLLQDGTGERLDGDLATGSMHSSKALSKSKFYKG